MECRVFQISEMLSEPLCQIPLHVRTHCATINVRGVGEFVIRKARDVLRLLPAEELSWRLYKWLAE